MSKELKKAIAKETPFASLSSILRVASEMKSSISREEFLKNHRRSASIAEIFRFNFHPKWRPALPAGDVEFKKMDESNASLMIYSQLRTLYVFSADDDIGIPNFIPVQRELKWISLLECISPEDANMLTAAKDGKLTKWFPKLTEKLGKKIFPEYMNY